MTAFLSKKIPDSYRRSCYLPRSTVFTSTATPSQLPSRCLTVQRRPTLLHAIFILFCISVLRAQSWNTFNFCYMTQHTSFPFYFRTIKEHLKNLKFALFYLLKKTFTYYLATSTKYLMMQKNKMQCFLLWVGFFFKSFMPSASVWLKWVLRRVGENRRGAGRAADVEPTSTQQLFALYQSLIFNVDVKICHQHGISKYIQTIWRPYLQEKPGIWS